MLEATAVDDLLKAGPPLASRWLLVKRLLFILVMDLLAWIEAAAAAAVANRPGAGPAAAASRLTGAWVVPAPVLVIAQVWSLSQFYSAHFSQSTICVK